MNNSNREQIFKCKKFDIFEIKFWNYVPAFFKVSGIKS